MKILCLLHVRDEEKLIERVLNGIFNQTVPFDDVILVDDASIDKTPDIAEDYGCNVVRLTNRHPSYVGRKEMALTLNEGIIEVYKYSDVSFFMQMGGDILLEKDYVESLLPKFDDDLKLMIASGRIKGEYSNVNHPRGAGRFYRFSFWDRYIKVFPVIYVWESYPVYKALSMGFNTRNFGEGVMTALRPTRAYKEGYGVSMRELGYLPIYAFARCFNAMRVSFWDGVKMYYRYLSARNVKEYDASLGVWLREYQRKNFARNVLRKLGFKREN